MRGTIERILRLARKKCQQAEVYAASSRQTRVEFKAGRLHTVEHKEAKGAGLRVIRRGRIGFSSTTDLDRLEDLVDHACQSADYGQPAHFDFPDHCRPARTSVFEQTVADLPLERAVAEGRRALDIMKKQAPELQGDATIDARMQRVEIGNSRGLALGYDKTYFAYYLSAVGVVDGHMLFLSDARQGTGLCWDTEDMVGKIVRQLKQSQTTAAIPSGRWPAIFAPEAAYIFWRALAMGVSGKMLQKRVSPLQGRLGESVLDRRVTIHDHPQLRQAWGSAPHDA